MPEPEADIEGNQWRCVGASVRGSSHELNGRPCEDAHRIAQPSVETIVIAVADGAGSAEFAEAGASTSTAAAVAALCRQLSGAELLSDAALIEGALREAVKEARDGVAASAQLRGARLEDLATTLILAVASPGIVAVAQIGDGGVVLRDKQGEMLALTAPQPGEYINETHFLTSADFMENLQVKVWRGETAQLALLSDGLQLLCLKVPTGEPHRPFFSTAFDFIEQAGDELQAGEQLLNFMLSPRVRAQTNDDLTLILANLGGVAASTAEQAVESVAV